MWLSSYECEWHKNSSDLAKGPCLTNRVDYQVLYSVRTRYDIPICLLAGQGGIESKQHAPPHFGVQTYSSALLAPLIMLFTEGLDLSAVLVGFILVLSHQHKT